MTVDTKRLRELLELQDFRPFKAVDSELADLLPALLDEVERLRAENGELAEYKAMYEGLCK